MKIYLDERKTDELRKKLVDKWEQISLYGDPHREYIIREESHARGDEYHVSDLIMCPMKKICQVSGLPRSVAKRAITMMLSGIVAQKLIQWLYTLKESEYEALIVGVAVGHVDVFESFMYPLEAKFSRKKILKREDLPQYWCRQLVSYISMVDKEKGWIIVINIFTSDIMAWCIEMNEEERSSQRKAITEAVKTLNYAINTKDYLKLFIHPSEYDFCQYRYVCPRRGECKARATRKIVKKDPLNS